MSDALRELLVRVDAGELGDPLPVLAYLAGQEVEIPDEELNGRGAARCCSSPPAATRIVRSASTTVR